MLKELIQLANRLDGKGLRKEADALDRIINKLAGSDDFGGWDPAKEGWNPDTGLVEELTDEDMELNAKRDNLWSEVKELAERSGMSLEDLLKLIDEKTTISEEIDALEEQKKKLYPKELFNLGDLQSGRGQPIYDSISPYSPMSIKG